MSIAIHNVGCNRSFIIIWFCCCFNFWKFAHCHVQDMAKNINMCPANVVRNLRTYMQRTTGFLNRNGCSRYRRWDLIGFVLIFGINNSNKGRQRIGVQCNTIVDPVNDVVAHPRIERSTPGFYTISGGKDKTKCSGWFIYFVFVQD